MSNSQTKERLMQAIAALPQDQREVFVFRTVSKLTFKDIAQRRNESLSKVLSSMHGAVIALKPVVEIEIGESNVPSRVHTQRIDRLSRGMA